MSALPMIPKDPYWPDVYRMELISQINTAIYCVKGLRMVLPSPLPYKKVRFVPD